MLKKLIFAALLVAALAVLMFVNGGFSARSGVRIFYVESAGRAHWRADYEKLDGSMARTLRPAGDELTVNIDTEAGEITVNVYDMHGELALAASEPGAHSIPAPKKVRIKIQARDHRGGFEIR